jgi:hypothetical protein
VFKSLLYELRVNKYFAEFILEAFHDTINWRRRWVIDESPKNAIALPDTNWTSNGQNIFLTKIIYKKIFAFVLKGNWHLRCRPSSGLKLLKVQSAADGLRPYMACRRKLGRPSKAIDDPLDQRLIFVLAKEFKVFRECCLVVIPPISVTRFPSNLNLQPHGLIECMYT